MNLILQNLFWFHCCSLLRLLWIMTQMPNALTTLLSLVSFSDLIGKSPKPLRKWIKTSAQESTLRALCLVRASFPPGGHGQLQTFLGYNCLTSDKINLRLSLGTAPPPQCEMLRQSSCSASDVTYEVLCASRPLEDNLVWQSWRHRTPRKTLTALCDQTENRNYQHS